MTTHDSSLEQEFTALLSRAADGDASAKNELMPLVYEQLRTIAEHRMVS